VAREEFGERDFTWDQLKGLMPGLRERLLQKQTSDDDFTPLFLDRLVGYLSKSRRKLLNALSVFRIPVGDEALKSLGVEMDPKSRRQLEDLSLLENLRDEGLYYVHRLTAHFLSVKMGPATRKRFHIRAAEYFEGIRDEEGKKYIEYVIESRHHFLEAGEWDRAAEITFDIENYLTLHGYPRDSFEMLREFDDKAVNEKNRSGLLHQLGILYQGFGAYDEALTHYRQSMKISEKIGDIKGVSLSLHQIGMIYQEKGAYDEALNHYRQSMEIKEKIGDIQGVSLSLHQIGMIYQEKGAYDEALNLYRQSMEIKEKIGDIKGVSSSLHNIGAIYQYKGAYDEALTHYRQSMEIKEKIGDIVGAALSYAQMGTLHFAKEEFEPALKLFIRAFLVFAKVGSPDAEKAAGDIASVREKLPEKRFDEILAEFGLELDEKESAGRFIAKE
jgi:tetratricopeptide (TPR) repeat protein